MDEVEEDHHYRRRRRPPPPIQYTPDYRKGGVGGAQSIQDATVISQAADPTAGGRQDPNSITGIQKWQWDLAWWDKVPLNPMTTPLEEQRAFIFPTNDTMRGLNQRFYEKIPFADVTAPTVAEIDRWNMEVIQLFRDLVGNPTPLESDHCLFLRAQWALERHFTDDWDADYSATGVGSSEGPCFLFGDPYPDAPVCGFEFIPDHIGDQDPYGYESVCTNDPTETISTTVDAWPWSIKMSKILSRLIDDYISSNGAIADIVKFQTAPKVGIAWNTRLPSANLPDDVIFKFSPNTF